MKQSLPRHVAIIPDGNRRWARQKGLKPWEGHAKAGTFDNLFPLFEEAQRLGIEYLTFWGFSTENWKRDRKEVDIIMRLILKGLVEFDKRGEGKNIRFRCVGRRDRMLKKLVEKMEELEEKTKDNTGLNVVLCLDYGGRDEIVRAVNHALEEKKTLKEDEFVDYLDSAGVPDLDLIIRTGGEKRLSGFMPFQSDYAELYFTDIYFPDFGIKELNDAIDWFSKIDRRFGK